MSHPVPFFPRMHLPLFKIKQSSLSNFIRLSHSVSQRLSSGSKKAYFNVKNLSYHQVFGLFTIENTVNTIVRSQKLLLSLFLVWRGSTSSRCRERTFVCAPPLRFWGSYNCRCAFLIPMSSTFIILAFSCDHNKTSIQISLYDILGDPRRFYLLSLFTSYAST